MPTLQEITLTHSQRLSEIHRTRDSRLAEALSIRDARLRGLPAVARARDDRDDRISAARMRQLAADAKSEEARAAAVREAVDRLASTIAEAERVRREADLTATAERRKAEEDAERELVLALAGQPSQPSNQAQKARAQKLDKAKAQFEAAQAAAHEKFRVTRDAAHREEVAATREADGKLAAAKSASATAARTESSAAEQAFTAALDALSDAEAPIADWREQTAAILATHEREEDEEFARFHAELRAVRN